MAVGPIVVDYLFDHPTSGRVAVDRMFWWASAVTAFSAIAAGAARVLAGPHTAAARRRVPMHWIIRRYHPGSVLLIGVAMGLGIGIPFYFLRPFTQQLGISGIRSFFFVYAVTAFSIRLVARQLPDRWGVRRTVLLGMGFLTADMFSFLLVRGEWSLMIPAVLGGVAHAFVFPAAMTGGSLAFPLRYRGIATSLMLTMFDLGNLVGQPAVGTMVWLARKWSLPAYPMMFLSVGAMMLLSMVAYALSHRNDAEDTETGSRAMYPVERRRAVNASKRSIPPESVVGTSRP
jgi:predicted MFS family arabinose efflux permease